MYLTHTHVLYPVRLDRSNWVVMLERIKVRRTPTRARAACGSTPRVKVSIAASFGSNALVHSPRLGMDSLIDDHGISEDTCQVYPDCSTCVSDPECGWCDNLCIAIALQPHRTCSDWRTTNCSVSCELFTDCVACTTQTTCGWCMTEFRNQVCFASERDHDGRWLAHASDARPMLLLLLLRVPA